LALRDALGGKASAESVESLKTQVAALKSQPTTVGGVVDVYPKSQTFTKEEVQALINNAVNNLRAELKGTTTSSSSSTTTTSGSSSTGGNVELTSELEVDDSLYLEEGDSQRWRYTIKNKSSSSKRFTITIVFSNEEKCGLTSSTDLDVDYGDYTSMDAKTSVNFSADISRIEYKITKSGSTNLPIAANAEEDLSFRWYVHYQDSSDSGSAKDDEYRDWQWSITLQEVN
jgi:hypothetical protein